MIKKIVLENYRVYDKFEMSFEDLQVIKGRNGTGKTTIVEAIGFALFGSALQRGKANSWVKEGCKDGSVILYIDDYIITRSTSLALVEDLDGNILARNRTGIVEWVENTYGLTAELYKTSFYIGQKDIGAFAALAPLERTKRVEKLLRIDRLDEIKERAKAKARVVNSNLDIYTAKLEGSNFNKELLDMNESAINEDKKSLEAANLIYEEMLVAQGEYKQAIIIWREKQALQTQFLGKIYDLEALEKEYKDMLERNANVDSHNKIAREKVILERKLKGVIVLEEYFNSDIRDVVDHENALIKFINLNNEVDRLKCDPVDHDVPSMMDSLKEKQKIYDLNKDIPEECPTCNQPWPKKLDFDLDTLAETIRLDGRALEKAANEKRMFDIKASLVEPKMTAEAIEDALRSLKYKPDYLRLQELSEESSELQQEESFHINLAMARKQNSIKDRLEEMKDIVEPEELDLNPQRARIRSLKDNISIAEKIITRELGFEAIEKEFSGLRDEAAELLAKLKEFIKFIDLYRKAFGANVIPLLEENVSNIVSYLSEGKYDSVKINPDYGVENFEYYSGSEQDSINFALRLAIAQVSKLGGFSTMLLDEIAASFDEQRENLLMDILKQQSNQLIYITHGEL